MGVCEPCGHRHRATAPDVRGEGTHWEACPTRFHPLPPPPPRPWLCRPAVPLQHFALAGTESGGECFCGNALNVPYAQRVSPQECSAPCRGTPHERCGGDWRIAVFNVSCSGTRVPPPYEAPLMNNPCLNGTFAALPFCDPKLPIDVRVADAVKRMTLDEKINALGTNTHAIKSVAPLPRAWPRVLWPPWPARPLRLWTAARPKGGYSLRKPGLTGACGTRRSVCLSPAALGAGF